MMKKKIKTINEKKNVEKKLDVKKCNFEIIIFCNLF